jgi:hypothetical protein
MKSLAMLLLLVGCATQTVPVATPNLAGIEPDCRYASYQMGLLEKGLMTASADSDNYRQIKNKIWSLRSTCSAYRS